MNDYAVRIHLNTCCEDREKLVKFCLKNKSQRLAIGWSYIYDEVDTEIHSFDDLYNAVKEIEGRVRPVLNLFWYAEKDDLFWTRDLDGNYWICRAKGKAKPYLDADKDIGAVIPVEAYNAGMQVTGQVKATFNRANGGIAQIISPDDPKLILEYSKSVFNKFSGQDYYTIEHVESDILDNLYAFDLEELVILYLQIKHNYCVLSNSIANKSTTRKIECELTSRSVEDKRKAVVQVKAGNDTSIDALDYKDYAEDGYTVYLYAPCVENADKVENVVVITRESLRSFYNEYKEILPDSTTMWETLVGE